MAKNFPTLIKNINLHIQKPQYTQSRKTKKSTLRHIIAKVLKGKEKEKILKVAKDKQFITFNEEGDLIA